MVTQVISLLERPVTVQTHACATGPLYDFHSEVLKTLYTIYHDFCTINYTEWLFARSRTNSFVLFARQSRDVIILRIVHGSFISENYTWL